MTRKPGTYPDDKEPPSPLEIILACVALAALGLLGLAAILKAMNGGG